MNEKTVLLQVLKTDAFLYILGTEGIIVAKLSNIWHIVLMLIIMLITAYLRSYLKYKYRVKGKGGEKVESLQKETSGNTGNSGS